MPSSDYHASTGGALKLKGAGSGSGITKKKKKKPKPAVETADNNTAESSKEAKDGNARDQARKDTGDNDEEEGALSRARDELQKHKASGAVKTEAELRFEEYRRKRMEEKMRKEGSKTHKERVEDLNRYLSKLSEHHDMPRIGPG